MFHSNWFATGGHIDMLHTSVGANTDNRTHATKEYYDTLVNPLGPMDFESK